MFRFHDLGSSPADLSGVCPGTGLSWYPLSRSGQRSAPVQALARALVCVAILLTRDAKIGRPAEEASSRQLAHITEQAALVPAGSIEGPLGMTHGWPGSIFELLKVVGPITDPTAHGGRAEDAFDLFSFQGYGFSGIPPDTGWVWAASGVPAAN